MKDKKVIYALIGGIITLVILTVGATYAYFAVGTNSTFTNVNATMNLEAMDNRVILTKTEEKLNLSVTAMDMIESKTGISYYASGSEEPATIGIIKATGEGNFKCTYKIKVSKSSTSEEKDLYNKFQKMENRSEGQIYIDINQTRYDFNTDNLFPIEYSETVNGIKIGNEVGIESNITIVNNNIDQTGINNGDITLTYEVTEFNCEVELEKKQLGEYLLSNPTTGLDTTTSYSGMYRYIGTTANNYVKIGDVLYRIIGVTSEANSTLGLAANQVKVIKATNIGTHQWHTSYSSDTKWESSTMYTYLQNDVLSNTSYIPSGWSNKISSVKWNIGDVQTYTNGDTVYGLEDNTQTTNTSKIGLMYLSDYYYAYNAGGTTNCGSTACTNWLTDTSNATWTMSRYGGSSYYNAWYVSTNGSVDSWNLNDTGAVRPVFYLSTSVNWKSGTGASGDPFIIE